MMTEKEVKKAMAKINSGFDRYHVRYKHLERLYDAAGRRLNRCDDVRKRLLVQRDEIRVTCPHRWVAGERHYDCAICGGYKHFSHEEDMARWERERKSEQKAYLAKKTQIMAAGQGKTGLDRSICDLRLSGRATKNLIMQRDVKTLGDLTQLTRRGIGSMTNIGDATFNEIVTKLAREGLTLKD